MDSVRGKIGLVGLGGSVLVALVTAGVAQAALQAPRPAVATAHGQSQPTSVGSYCVSAAGVAQCADQAPLIKPPKRRLGVARGTTVTVVFRHRRGLQDEVRSIQVHLVRIHDGEERSVARPADVRSLGGRTWRLRLPRKLAGANLLRVFARFDGGGDASHHIGLRRIRKRRLECPIEPHTPVRGRPLLGLEISAARREVRRRGCELRVARRDGKDLVDTLDLRAQRVNVAVAEGTVRRVLGIF